MSTRRALTIPASASNPTVDIGDYNARAHTDEPILDPHVPDAVQKPLPGPNATDRIGRTELLNTPFEPSNATSATSFSGHWLRRIFDAAKDVNRITVKPLAARYAMNTTPMFRPRLDEREQPARHRPHPLRPHHHRNSDSGAQAYTDSAIDQAFRAVEEAFEIG